MSSITLLAKNTDKDIPFKEDLAVYCFTNLIHLNVEQIGEKTKYTMSANENNGGFRVIRSYLDFRSFL